MKKILSNIYLLAALFMIGAAITSCSKSDDTPTPEPKPVGPTTYTMTIKATKAADAKTRALIPVTDGQGKETINAEWAKGEKVSVYKGETYLGDLEAQSSGASTTLMGTLTGTIKADDELTLKFCSPNYYATQDGTLEYIAANCDYATARVDVNSVSNTGDIIPKAATTAFTNHQAIVKFTLKDYNGAALSPNPTTLTVKYGENGENSISLSIPPSTYNTNGDGVLYVAIPGITNQKVTLTATVGNDTHNTYTYVKSGVTFTNGQYYAINVSMVNPYKTPLTFQSRSDYNTITVNNIYYIGNNPSLQYSLNGGEWTDYNEAITLSNNDIISFRGTTVTYYNSNPTADNKTTIHSSYNCYVYGNIMSLLDPDTKDFSIMTELPYSNTFENLFYDSTFSHKEGWDLVLPATTLTNECYQQMFTGSSNLDRAPDLPADRVPDKAYANMFGNCSSLKYIKCLATYLGTNSTDQWVVGVPIGSDGTFVRASDTQTTWGAQNDYCGIPSGWTVTTE